MTPEARKAWADSVPDLAKELADNLDKSGQPGTEMIRAYIDKLRAQGATPIRDWTIGLK
ncbi:hypothetical protein ACLKMH_03555 [Psychromonas sp. KJ10-10]|uniref:hypothetical protein n=1 Tax=Psychromonas sp. KJ10-10 TaxID=3391823 RepID=UPI0039B4B275